jgi:hypothetical protein
MYGIKKIDDDEKLRSRAKKIGDSLVNQPVAV